MRLLVLEDDPAQSRLVLNACPWASQVEHCSSLRDAIAFMGSNDVDVVLTGLRLRETRGVEVVERLHDARGEVPIVVLCPDDDGSTVELLRAGAQDCIDTSSIGADAVHRVVLHAIERQRAVHRQSEQTERGHVLREKLATQERLTALGQLAAGVAHEINNPAAYVLSSLEASLDEVAQLRRDSTEPGFLDARLQQIYGKLQLAFEGMRRIQSVMQELRSFGRTDLVAEPFQLAEAVDSAVRLVRNQVDQVASLEVAIDPDLVIAGTSDAVKQVITNLVLNATQAFPRSKPDENLIRVRAHADAGMVRVTVQDNGPGIPQELHSRIFEPFVTTKPAQSGMGLGLSICRDIAIRHGGSLEFEDAEQGACFVLTLPLSQRRVAPGEGERPAAIGPLDHKPVVLLIEDEPHVRLSFASALSGYAEVLTADSGQSATELVRSTKRIDTILCDLAMPRMSGPEFYAWLEEHEPGLCTSVVFVTGGAFNARAEAFLQTHDVTVVHKPCTRRELRSAIEGVTSRAKKHGPARTVTARPHVG